MLIINILGGAAVLGSYYYGFMTHPNGTEILWGGVPHNIRSISTPNMFLAAAGYFAFTLFILFRLNPRVTRVFDRFGFGLFNILYAGILLPSALWMPLTFLAIEQSSPGLIWTVRLVLVVVGLASLGLLLSLVTVKPRLPSWAHKIAIIGVVFFCIQTVLMDAILWGFFFRL